ncbi:MAG TPA: hypothetical protein DHV62_05635 [Elusimicrobia bacterium]|jgi:hypothetical protein|nr:hypothetical protein [Elusimicrobiota bacterium]
MEYTRKIDWQINHGVKTELVKRCIDVSKVCISTTKGNVEIKGQMQFTGQGVNIYDSPTTIASMLRKLELAIRAISYVRGVKFQFDSWKRMGSHWEYNPPKREKD